MNLKERRRANLLRLIEKHGGKTPLARKLDLPASYVWQMAKDPKRGPGDAVCEKIERLLGLPTGWMDMHHDERDESALLGVDVGLLRRCIKAWRVAEEQTGIELSEEEVAKALVTLYREAHQGAEISEDDIARSFRLLSSLR